MRFVPAPEDCGPDTARIHAWSTVPAFVWPADRAWCVTFDVDPDFATVGGPVGAIAAIVRNESIDAVPFDPSDELPYFV